MAHSTSSRSTSARWFLGLAATLLISLTVWWTERQPGTPPRDAGWEADAFVLAGDGIAGMRDDQASRARFSEPFGVAVSGDGTVYVTDAGEAQRIRGISPDGRVFTVAGGRLGFADGVGQAARFNTPSGLAIDRNGTLYVADTANNVIRRIARDGRVATLAGDGSAGHRDGAAHEARFNGPIGVAVDASGRVIVADTYNDRIRAIHPDGTVSTLAGGDAPGAVDGVRSEARFDTPSGVAVGRSGTIHVADTGNGLLRAVDLQGRVTTRAWSGADGVSRPLAVATGPADEVYVTDERGRIAEVRADGATRTVAGSGPGFRDGPGGEARFRHPSGVAVITPTRLVVSDTGNALVRLVARSGLQMRPPGSPLIAPRFDI
ncbi:MAG: SMP-30/gluconolactonase/LRE family protein, partial [Vicinamibacterales bacterium]